MHKGFHRGKGICWQITKYFAIIATINAKNVSITALVIPTTMLENFITTLSTATESAVIMITSYVVENFLMCDIQAVDER
jgi:hypothetical protein